MYEFSVKEASIIIEKDVIHGAKLHIFFCFSMPFVA